MKFINRFARILTLTSLVVVIFFSSLSNALAQNRSISGTISLPDSVIANDDEFVMVMLNYDSWPMDVNKQQELTKKLQQEALDGPLSQGFKLVHQFKTIPALSGWLSPVMVDNEPQFDGASRKQQMVESNSIIRSIDVDTGGSNRLNANADSGSGNLSVSVPQIGADRIHALGIQGQGVEIAVLDTGIDTNHPDLSDSVGVQQCFCFNPNGNCCPNGNFQQSGAGSAEDDNNHGSHVSGIIGSNGSIASVGVAPRATLTLVKVLDADNSFYSSSDIVSALDWLNVNRPSLDAVNMSLGTVASFSGVCDSSVAFTQAMFLAVENLVSKGVVVVASSGNGSLVGEMGAPACLSNTVSVGAVDSNDSHAFFSNTDTTLDVYAPGVSIVSSVTGGQTAAITGTSMSCGHVSGLAGLIKQASPDASRAQIVNAITQNGVLVTGPSNIVAPRIDAFNAVCSIFNCTSLSGNTFLPAMLNLLFEEE